MGTHYFKCPNTGNKIGYKANFMTPDFIKGWWSTDKDGRKEIKKAYLEDTVYFHIETQGIRNGNELELKLYEYDSFMGVDSLNPDDDEFNDKEIIKTAKVKIVNGQYIATVELTLDDNWTTLIKDDPWPGKQIELYWKVSFKRFELEKNLPLETDNYLKVRNSERDLYVKPYEPGTQLPELVSTNGGSVLLLNMAKGEVKKRLAKGLVSSADRGITNIALCKLEQGNLISNQGKEYIRSSVTTRDIYANNGKLLKNVKIANNMGNGSYTTKGISQFDYYATQGVKVKVLGILKSLGSIFDLISFVKFLHQTDENGLDHTKPLSLPLGIFTPLNELAGLLVSDFADAVDESLDEMFQKDMERAKAEGLSAVERLIPISDKKYKIKNIQRETAEALLDGRLRTLNELDNFNDSIMTRKSDDDNIYLDDEIEIPILYRITEHPIKGNEIYIVETIFINE